jgi:hypothetical protein
MSVSTLIYSSETWEIINRDQNQIQTVEIQMKVLGSVALLDKKRSNDIREELEIIH